MEVFWCLKQCTCMCLNWFEFTLVEKGITHSNSALRLGQQWTPQHRLQSNYRKSHTKETSTKKKNGKNEVKPFLKNSIRSHRKRKKALRPYSSTHTHLTGRTPFESICWTHRRKFHKIPSPAWDIGNLVTWSNTCQESSIMVPFVRILTGRRLHVQQRWPTGLQAGAALLRRLSRRAGSGSTTHGASATQECSKKSLCKHLLGTAFLVKRSYMRSYSLPEPKSV